MGWKGGQYYRSRRIGPRVVTDYYGGGEIGQAAEMLDQLERERLQAEREELRALEEQDQEDGRIFDQVDNLVTAALLVAGCYKHHGTWRKGRGDGKTNGK